MNGQPESAGRAAGTLDTVPGVGGDEDPVARRQREQRSILEPKIGPTGKQSHPLILFLVVPRARWRAVALGVNPDNAQGALTVELFDKLTRAGERTVVLVIEIAAFHACRE